MRLIRLVFSLATLSAGCGGADPANDPPSDATNGALQEPEQRTYHRSTKTVPIIPRQPDTKGHSSAAVDGPCGTLKLELTTARVRSRILLLAELYVTPTKTGLSGPAIDPVVLPSCRSRSLGTNGPLGLRHRIWRLVCSMVLGSRTLRVTGTQTRDGGRLTIPRQSRGVSKREPLKAAVMGAAHERRLGATQRWRMATSATRAGRVACLLSPAGGCTRG
jgi:hypothetical protein